ncbi:MAG: hypothetical protein R3C20_25510 [Planctomycetaceae bacterium]
MISLLDSPFIDSIQPPIPSDFSLAIHKTDDSSDLLHAAIGPHQHHPCHEPDPAFARRLFALREQLKRLNKRSSGPFSHPLSTHGPLRQLREHICDLSRLADAALLSAEISESSHSQTLLKDLRVLLKTLQAWTSRLENQIWRLESQQMWTDRLQKILAERCVSEESVTSFCDAISRETISVPCGSLLLPEPGLPVVRHCSGSNSRPILPTELSASNSGRCAGLDKDPGWSVEQIRISVYTASTILPEMRASDVAVRALQLSSEKLRLILPSTTSSTSAMQPPVCVAAEPHSIFAGGIAVPGHRGSEEQPDLPLLDSLCLSAQTALQWIHETSLSAGEMLIPPAVADFYRPVLIRLSSEPDASPLNLRNHQMKGQILKLLGIRDGDYVTDSTDAGASPSNSASALSLSATEEQLGRSAILAHKLRWHAGEPPARSGMASAAKKPSHAEKGPTRHFRSHAVPPASLSIIREE